MGGNNCKIVIIPFFLIYKKDEYDFEENHGYATGYIQNDLCTNI